MSSSSVFYRKLNQTLPRIVRGEGIYLYDDAGKRYLDACGGAMVCCIGHGVGEIADAMAAQARKVAYVNGTAFTNEPVESLASFLAAKAPPPLDRVYFLSSGSEATEAALKLARQYHVERGEAQRRTVIAQAPGYHGNTLMALSASARGHYRTMFLPWLSEVATIEAPYPYRRETNAAALEEAIEKAGAQNVAAFIAEPIGGSSTGASVPPPDYFAAVRRICDRHGILFIADEVLTGAGRTGKYFGIDHFRTRDGSAVAPDIMTMGKGLNGGYAPLSAIIVRSTIVEQIARGTGNFMHAQTYSHNPLACATALAVQRYIEERKLVARVETMGPQLGARLQRLRETRLAQDIVGDVRGIGMLWAVELVAGPGTKQPFARSLRVAETLVDIAHANGLVLWPNVGHAGGQNGDLVMIAPPFTIALEEMDELAELLARSVSEVAGRVSKTTAAASP